MKRLNIIYVACMTLFFLNMNCNGMQKELTPANTKESTRAIATQCRKAIIENDLETAKICLIDKKLNPNIQDKFGDTFLHVACAQWCKNQYLLRFAQVGLGGRGDRTNATDDKVVVLHSHLKTQEAIIAALIERGACINRENELCNRPFDAEEALSLLNDCVLRPFKDAIKQKDTKTVFKLIKQGVDLNAKIYCLSDDESIDCQYPLLCAAHCDNLDAFLLMLDHGARPDLTIKERHPIPLIHHLDSEYPQMAESLFSHVPKCRVRHAWNKVSLPWIMQSKGLAGLPLDLRILIANWVVLAKVLEKQLKRTGELIELSPRKEISDKELLATYKPAWLKNYWQTLATRPQKLDAGLLPSPTVVGSNK